MVSLCAALLLCVLCIVVSTLLGGWLGRRHARMLLKTWMCRQCDGENPTGLRHCAWCGKARRDR